MTGTVRIERRLSAVEAEEEEEEEERREREEREEERVEEVRETERVAVSSWPAPAGVGTARLERRWGEKRAAARARSGLGTAEDLMRGAKAPRLSLG